MMNAPALLSKNRSDANVHNALYQSKIEAFTGGYETAPKHP